MIDPAKLSEWFDADAGGLVLYARQWLSDRALAEDVVQDAFVSLMAESRGGEPPNVRAWLYRAVRNAAISASRSTSRRGRRERAVAGERGAWFEPRPHDLLDAAAAQAALECLPATQREVVVLRLWSGLTLAGVAEVTGLPVSSVFDQYRAALAAIRKHMGAVSCEATANPKGATK